MVGDKIYKGYQQSGVWNVEEHRYGRSKRKSLVQIAICICLYLYPDLDQKWVWSERENPGADGSMVCEKALRIPQPQLHHSSS